MDLTQVTSGVQRIKSRGLFSDYVSKTPIFTDAWSIFFKQPLVQSSDLPGDRQPFAELHHHSIYREVDLASYLPFLNLYFSPSERVLDRQTHLVNKYGLDPIRTVAINIRGTDKHTEIESPELSTYLELASESLSRDSTKRILLVTDQRQYLEKFQKAFKSSLVFIDELPTTYGETVIHKQLRRNQREDFGLNFLATVLIMSRAKEVITHTGNGAFWTSLFRGGTKGLTQLRGGEVFSSES